MNLLEQRILAEGQVALGDVLKVGGFLNHCVDVPFLTAVCEEFYNRYRDDGVTKLLTVETSGIAVACLTAQYFGLPVVFAKKSRTSNISGDVYTAKAYSYTHSCFNSLVVEKQLLDSKDKVLIIDDFLANGSSLSALADIVAQSGATAVGAGIVIEKVYQGGGNALREKGLRVESLARIASLSQTEGIVFCD